MNDVVVEARQVVLSFGQTPALRGATRRGDRAARSSP